MLLGAELVLLHGNMSAC